jgi:hypothetical protein
MNIDLELARKVLSIVDAGLTHGLGKPEPGQMCVEAAVNYALGAPHGDQPACVASSLRSLKIRLNDASWSSNEARTKGLRRLAIAQLGSAGALDEGQFVARCAQLAIQTCVPSALREATRVCREPHKTRMLVIAERCEREPTRKNAIEARNEANAAAYAAAYADAAYAYADAAYAAAYDAYVACADAACADAYAACADADAADCADCADAAYAADAACAACAYAADACAAAYAADASNKLLEDFAEGVVQILIDMKAPGVQWLYLTEET